MNSEILKFCLEKGLLVDKEVLDLFSETSDVESVKLIIEKIKTTTKNNVITKHVFDENKEKVSRVFLELPKENQKKLEKLKIKLGLSIEISKEISIEGKNFVKEREDMVLSKGGNVRVFEREENLPNKIF